MKVKDIKNIPIGTELILVDTMMGPTNKSRILSAKNSINLMFTGEGIAEGRYSYCRFPKASELVETEQGFKIVENGEVMVEYVFPNGKTW